MRHKILQIIDANLNRSREGLRVCEDILRFFAQDKSISKDLKKIRHGASNALMNSKHISFKHLLKGRDTANDPSKFMDFEKPKDTDITDIFMSNMERVKESLRVLEECSKLIDNDLSIRYRKLRFNAYHIEKKAVAKIRLKKS